MFWRVSKNLPAKYPGSSQFGRSKLLILEGLGRCFQRTLRFFGRFGRKSGFLEDFGRFFGRLF